MRVPISVLDLAFISESSTAAETFKASVSVAQAAERLGYLRYWFAEHHNMPTIASSAPSILIAHIASQTSRIRVGSGGIMLPNHSPLIIAEQFGTLATLYPGRIDLGVGRAPGGDPKTFAALRRDPSAAERFPQDILEVQTLLGPEAGSLPVQAIPGANTQVPIYILGSSLFGAKLAAARGLPYAFASHFAPDALEDAVALYRREFKPSQQLQKPYVIAGFNVIAAEESATAKELYLDTLRRITRSLIKRSPNAAVPEGDARLLATAEARHARSMLHYCAVGNPAEVKDAVERFVSHARADELMIVGNIADPSARLRSFEILADIAIQ